MSVYGESDNSGRIVKRGAGSLVFAAYQKVMDRSYVMDYYVNIDVQEGKLSLYQGGTKEAEYFYSLSVHVAEDAELALCVIGRSYLESITGKGVITKEFSSENQRMYLYGKDHTVFEGRLVGKQIRIENLNGRHDFTCPTNDIFTIIVQAGSTAGLSSFGESTTSLSSLGTGNLNFSGDLGRVVYLGTTGQVTPKPWWIGSWSVFDGGDYGGVTFTGSWGSSYSENYNLRKIEVSGDHANECVVETSIPEVITTKNKPDVFTRYYIRKTGAGTWRFGTGKQTSRRGMGVVDVENGTLRFDSIAERGMDSSLGLADWLFPDVRGASNDVPQVGYAYVLGGIAGEDALPTEGTMEYTGAEDGSVSTRPFAIRSRGRIKTTGSAFSFADAFALGTGEKTLVVDSEFVAGKREPELNKATLLSDGSDGGRLSVEKHGSGEWMLCGTNTCTGSAFVRNGTLLINNPGKKYRWYRFVVLENAYACDRYFTDWSASSTNEFGVAPATSVSEMGQVQIAEIALYDKDGNNLIEGFTQKTPITQFAYDGGDARVMDPGEVALGNTGNYVNFTHSSQYLQNVCDGTSVAATGRLSASDGGIKPSDPSTHLPIVVRLPDNSPPAVRLDFACGRPQECYGDYKTYNGRNMTAFRLDASADGLHWDLGITGNECENIEVPSAGYGASFAPRWDSDNSKMASDVSNRPGLGMELKFLQASEEYSVNRYAFSGYGAADGAKLRVLGERLTVSSLRVDAAAGAGVLENVELAADGVIDVFNLESKRDAVDLPVDISALAGNVNVNAWKVRINGRDSGWSCRMNAGGSVRISPVGIYLIVR